MLEEKAIFKFIVRVRSYSRTLILKYTWNGKTSKFCKYCVSMHWQTLLKKVIPWTIFVGAISIIQELVTSLMFTFADQVDFKGWGGTRRQQFHLNSTVNLFTEPCTLVGVLVRFIVLQDRLFTRENGVLISTECASWEIPWITK